MATLFACQRMRMNVMSVCILCSLPACINYAIVTLKIPYYCDYISSQNLDFLRNPPECLCILPWGHLLSSYDFPLRFRSDLRPGSRKATTGIGKTHAWPSGGRQPLKERLNPSWRVFPDHLWRLLFEMGLLWLPTWNDWMPSQDGLPHTFYC